MAVAGASTTNQNTRSASPKPETGKTLCNKIFETFLPIHTTNGLHDTKLLLPVVHGIFLICGIAIYTIYYASNLLFGGNVSGKTIATN